MMERTPAPGGHAFISYVRDDVDRAEELQELLQTAGIQVWRDTDELMPGEDWQMVIRHAISDNSLVFLACFSQNSASRRKSFQNEELRLAVDQLRLRQPDEPWLIPVRFDDCHIPAMSIGGERTLSSIQRADLFGERRDAETARLVAAVHRILGTRSGQSDSVSGGQPTREVSAAGEISQRRSPGLGSAVTGGPSRPSPANGSKRPGKPEPSPKRRALIWSGSIGSAVVIASAVALGTNLSNFIFTPATPAGHSSGAPSTGPSRSTSPTSAQTVGMSAAFSNHTYRILFPVSNALSTPQSISRISLVASVAAPACAEVPEILYKIQSTIAVKKPGGQAHGAVSAESGPLSGFAVPAQGKLYWGCGALDQLHLVFVPSGLILQPRSETDVVIDLPRKLHVTYQYLPSKKRLYTTVNWPDMSRTWQPYLALRVTATMSGGNVLDSCFALSVVPKIQQGPRNCNSTIDGNHVFRPFV